MLGHVGGQHMMIEVRGGRGDGNPRRRDSSGEQRDPADH
jgi:hypothetical protein